MEGFTDEFLEGLNQTESKYIKTMKYPDVLPVMRIAKNEGTRKAIDMANGGKCVANAHFVGEIQGKSCGFEI